MSLFELFFKKGVNLYLLHFTGPNNVILPKKFPSANLPVLLKESTRKTKTRILSSFTFWRDRLASNKQNSVCQRNEKTHKIYVLLNIRHTIQLRSTDCVASLLTTLHHRG